MRIIDWSSDVCSSDLQKREAVVQASSAHFHDATIDQLKSLREALGRAAADPASRSQVLEHIREEAFQIKGMGGVFGYPMLTEFAKSLHAFLDRKSVV